MVVSDLTLENVLDAAELIRPFIHKTPILTSRSLDTFSSTSDYKLSLVFKCENFQKVGAFKMRGATHAVRRILQEIDDPTTVTVVTHSSGNHAQALALAARELRVHCQVVMPSNAPDVKKNAVKGYGAIVTECTPTLQAREDTVETIIKSLEQEAQRLKKTSIVRLVPPYDHPHIICGQGTIAVELLEQAQALGRPLDVLIAPVGGGGMLSGVSLAAKGLNPGILVFGAEPEAASDAQQSFRSKTFHPSVDPNTVADGLLTSLGEITFPLILKYVDDIFTVNDTEIIRAMKLVWERLKIVIEPSAAVTFAVVLFSEEFKNRMKALSATLQRDISIGLVFSGGNVDFQTTLELFSRV